MNTEHRQFGIDPPERQSAHTVVSTIRIRPASIAEIDLLSNIDSDASALFLAAGLDLEPGDSVEFERAERQRWLRCLENGTCWIAMDLHDEPAGFAAMSLFDAAPYLQQISVRTRFMRRGIGTALIGTVERAAIEANHAALWLTTYAHLPWNRPFYERCGFEVVSEAVCGPELRALLDYERRWLPESGMRIVMRKHLDGANRHP